MTHPALSLPKTLFVRQGRTFPEVEASLRRAVSAYRGRAGRLAGVWSRPISAGKWSPAQLTDHLTRANWLYAEAFVGYYERDKQLELPVGRFSEHGRMIADAALPEVGDRERDELLQAFVASAEALITAAHRVETRGSLYAVVLTGGFFGPLTGLECLQFASVHILHHTRQLPEKGP